MVRCDVVYASKALASHALVHVELLALRNHTWESACAHIFDVSVKFLSCVWREHLSAGVGLSVAMSHAE